MLPMILSRHPIMTQKSPFKHQVAGCQILAFSLSAYPVVMDSVIHVIIELSQHILYLNVAHQTENTILRYTCIIFGRRDITFHLRIWISRSLGTISAHFLLLLSYCTCNRAPASQRKHPPFERLSFHWVVKQARHWSCFLTKYYFIQQ